VANSLPDTKAGLTAHARVYSLEKQAAGGARREEGCADRTTEFFTLDLAPFLKENVALGEIGVARFERKTDVGQFFTGWAKRARITGKLKPAGRGTDQDDGENGADGDEQRKVKVVLEMWEARRPIELKLTLVAADGKTRCCRIITAITMFHCCREKKKEDCCAVPETGGRREQSPLGLRGWNLGSGW